MIIEQSNVTLRNNSIVNNTDNFGGTVAVRNGSQNHLITGNIIANNANNAMTGLEFVSAGAGSRVENNVIVGNGLGVEFDGPGGDLGGGAAGSSGGNVISCNVYWDLWTNSDGITIDARNNAWDHDPPTVDPSSADIFNGNSGTAATINVTGNVLAPCPCP